MPDETFADQLAILRQVANATSSPYRDAIAALLEQYERLREALYPLAASTTGVVSLSECKQAAAALADCPPLKE